METKTISERIASARNKLEKFVLTSVVIAGGVLSSSNANAQDQGRPSDSNRDASELVKGHEVNETSSMEQLKNLVKFINKHHETTTEQSSDVSKRVRRNGDCYMTNYLDGGTICKIDVHVGDLNFTLEPGKVTMRGKEVLPEKIPELYNEFAKNVSEKCSNNVKNALDKTNQNSGKTIHFAQAAMNYKAGHNL